MKVLDRRLLASSLTCALLALPFAASAADSIVRRSLPDFPIASSVAVPGAARIVFVSGTLADVAKPDAPAGSTERLGDTETQAASVLAKIEKELAASELTMADVVKMNVFMVGDPAKGGGIVPVVGVDGWIKLMNDHAQADGVECVEHDVGRIVGVRIVHLVQQLLAERVERDAPAGAGRLRETRDRWRFRARRRANRERSDRRWCPGCAAGRGGGRAVPDRDA